MTDDKMLLVHDVMNEPFIELPLQALKARRNLLLSSILMLIIVKFGDITASPQILGIQGPTLPPFVIKISLLLITLYFLVYFSWLGLQTFRKWKLRLTGLTLRKAIGDIRTTNRLVTDNSIEQSTAIKQILMITQTLTNELQAIITIKDNGLTEISVKKITEKLTGVKCALENAQKAADTIAPFNKCFWAYQKSYAFHWVLEYLFPLVLGVAAILSMLIHLVLGPIYAPALYFL